MENEKSIAHNTVIVYIRLIVTTVFGLAATRFALQALGQSDYGLYNVVGGVVTLLNVISTAMVTTTRRFVNIEMGKKGDINKIFNICFFIHFCFAILLLILAESIGLLYIYNYLSVDAEKFQTALQIFHISTITAVIGVINVPYQSLIAAHERFDIVTYIDVATNLLKLIAVLLLFSFEDDRLLVYAILMSIVTGVSLISYYLVCRNIWIQDVKFRIVKGIKQYKEILVFNNYITLGAFSYTFRSQGSNMLINYFFGTLVNGAFSIAYMIENYSLMIVSNLTTAVNPQLTQSYAAGDKDRTFMLTCKVNKYSMLFMLILFVVLNIELENILTIWLGSLPLYATELCRWTLISAFVRSTGEGISPYIQATGKLKWFQVCSTIIDILAILATYILYSYGYGPQWVIICYTIISLFYKFFSFYLLSVLTDFKVLSFIKKSYYPVFKSFVVVIIYFIMYNKYIRTSNVLESFIGIVVSGVFVLLITIIFSLDKYEKKQIIKLLNLNNVKL